MTDSPIDMYLENLGRDARAAGAAEEVYRSEVMRKIRTFEQERAFAFRRLNFVRAIAAAVAAAKDQEEATAHGTAALLHEVNWSGATEFQREAIGRFVPVIEALWRMKQNDGTPDSAARALSEYESWFLESRNTPFLALMEVEVVELPLVEV